jgi:hypothetical protein
MRHLTIQQREGYQDGTLELAEEYLAIEAHLADCVTCREHLQSPSRAMPQGIGSLLTTDAHPDTALIGRYARDNSDVPAIVAQHMVACARCQRDVDALQAYRRAVTPEIWAEARAALETPVAARPNFRDWFRITFSVRALRVWVPVAAVCLLLVAVFWWRNQRVVEITDGSGHWTLTRAGQLTGPTALPPALTTLSREALRNRRVETPASLTALVDAADTHYGPAGTVIIGDMPTLRWEPLPGAVSYRCVLTSPDDPTFKRGAPKPIRGTFWKLKKPLPRGKVYTWKVMATLRNGRHVPLAGAPRFRVLEQARADALEQASRTYASSHLTLGLLYAREGVLDDAEQEFAALLRLNPGSETIKTLLDRLRARRRPIG